MASASIIFQDNFETGMVDIRIEYPDKYKEEPWTNAELLYQKTINTLLDLSKIQKIGD